MMTVRDIQEWLATLRPETGIAIRGLQLVQILEDGRASGNYLQLAPMPIEGLAIGLGSVVRLGKRGVR